MPPRLEIGLEKSATVPPSAIALTWETSDSAREPTSLPSTRTLITFEWMAARSSTRPLRAKTASSSLGFVHRVASQTHEPP